MFYNTDIPKEITKGGPEVKELAGRMSDAWIQFAHIGNPNHKELPEWPAYDLVNRTTMVFDNTCNAVSNPSRVERELWEDLKFDFKHWKDIERLAIVGESKWEAGMAVFCKPFTAAKIQYFDHTKLDEAKALAAKKGVTSHPDFDKAETDLAAAEKKAAEAKQGFDEAQAAAAASSKEVDADVKVLLDEYKRVEPLFAKATGYVGHYNDLKPVKELLSEIEHFEKNDLDKINTEMKTFAQKYGSTREEIDQKADAMGYSGQNRASFPFTELSEGIENVQKTRTVMDDDLVRRASDTSLFSPEIPSIKSRAFDQRWCADATKIKGLPF